MEVGGKGNFIYLSLHCHDQNDSCIKMGSNESHFNVSLILSDKVTRQCPQTTTFEEKGEAKRGPSAYQPNALPLGQTVSSIPIFPIVSRFDLACGFLPFGLSLFCLYLCLVLSYLRLCCV